MLIKRVTMPSKNAKHLIILVIALDEQCNEAVGNVPTSVTSTPLIRGDVLIERHMLHRQVSEGDKQALGRGCCSLLDRPVIAGVDRMTTQDQEGAFAEATGP